MISSNESISHVKVINFLLINPRSLNNKVDLLMGMLEDNSIDIAAVCETWITGPFTPTTASIKEHGYLIAHNFRPNRRGGGTALIFKASLKLSPFKYERIFETFEFVMCSLKTNSCKMLFVTIYRTGYVTSIFNQELDLLLSDISTRFDTFVIAGDLNLHFENCIGTVKQTLDIFTSYGMKKLVNEPTHINGSSLDQIFVHSNNKSIVSSLSVDSQNVLGSDHFPVFCTFNVTVVQKYFKTIQFRNLKNMDNTEFESELKSVLNNFKSGSDFSVSITELCTSMTDILNKHAPYKEKTVSVVDSAPWFDSEYRNLRKLRRKAERIKDRSLDHLLNYKELCTQATMLASIKKKDYIESVIGKSNNKPRTLYQMVNRVLDRNQSKGVPDYTDDIQQLASDFNMYFVDKIDKIRANMIESQQLVFKEQAKASLLCEFEPTSLEEMGTIIKECGINCSPADILPQNLYEENITSLLPLIVDLVNLSLSSGSMEGVKVADIVPLLKDSSLDHNNMKSYRPVSNLTFLGKLIERVVLRRLEDHLNHNNLNCNEQFAYKKHHSTETLLVKLTNDLLIASDEKSATVVMLLDLSAAFDTVDHDVLLKILKYEIGVKGTALAWFTSFLKGRSQCIRLGKITSDTVIIKFGVPQGSVLGPVLFNLYIRSIYTSVKRLGFIILGYADDHQIYKPFTCCNQIDTLIIQLKQCFHLIKSWMSKYFLQLNDSKTKVIVCGSRSTLDSIKLGGVNMTGSTTVRFVSSVKNLGFIMDSQLNFEKQIVDIKKKCFNTIRNIRKIRYLLNTDQCKLIVNSMVISCLDYGNSLYFGVSEKLLNQLQLIQNSASKVVMKKYKYDHINDDLTQLHWLPIKKRIIFKIALLTHKALIGLAPKYLQEMFSYSHHGRRLKLIIPNFRSSYGKRSFSCAAPRIYNHLPTTVTTSKDIYQFKNSLKTFLFNLTDYELKKLYNS